MEMRSFAKIAVLVPAVANCSHHPIPRDVVRNATPSIVNSVRCETRDAIEKEVIARFRSIGKEQDHEFTSKLATAIEVGEVGFDEVKEAVKRKLIHAKAASIYSRYDTYVVGYEFEFTITESNDETAGAKFALPIPNGTFSLDFTAGHERERKNIRTVKLSDSFQELFRKLTDKVCARDAATVKNWDYPIAGTIGMRELVKTFLTLNENLRTDNNDLGVNLFSDKLTFTTKYSTSIAPKVTLAPVTSDFHLTEGSGNFSADRTDVHQVQVAFTAPPPEKVKPDPIEVVILNRRSGTTKTGVRGGRTVVRPSKPATSVDRAKRKIRRDLRELRTQDLIDRIPEE